MEVGGDGRDCTDRLAWVIMSDRSPGGPDHGGLEAISAGLVGGRGEGPHCVGIEIDLGSQGCGV